MNDEKRLPGYDFHKSLVDQFHAILDEAFVEYDSEEDLVEDFAQHAQAWASLRKEEGK